MAAPPDIDAAFEALVAREQASTRAIQGALGTLRGGLAKLSHTPFYPAFYAAVSARQEFIAQAADWVQYAVDENVMGALAEKIGIVFGACGGPGRMCGVEAGREGG